MTGPAIQDEALPGLAAALTGEIASRLAKALASASGGAWTIEAAEPVRFRYRPGARAIVQYALSLRGPQGPSPAPAALWFFAGGKAAKLTRRAAGSLGADMLPPAIVEPTTGALLQVFPHDHRIPEIATFLRDPDRYRPALLDGATTRGSPELVRFRPGLCATFRWRLSDGRQTFIKIRPDADPAKTFAELQRLHGRGAEPGFRTARPLGLAPGIAAVSFEGIPGTNFSELLASGRLPDIRAAARRAAAALAAFHGSDVSFAREVDRGAFIRRAAAAAAWIETVCPAIGHSARRLAGWIAETPVCLRPGPAHLDSKPEHVVVGQRTITLLDLDTAAESDRAYDLAMLEMRIRAACMAGTCRSSRADAALGALHEAYPPDDDASWLTRYTWLRACAALEVAKRECHQLSSAGSHQRAGRLLDVGRPDNHSDQRSFNEVVSA